MEGSPFEYMWQSLIDETPGHMGRQAQKHTSCFEMRPRFVLGSSRKGKVKDLSTNDQFGDLATLSIDLDPS